MAKRSSINPSNLEELAKRVANPATGMTPIQIEQPGKNQAAVALGRLGGLKGGNARAKNLSATRRSEIARKAAQARWEKWKINGVKHMPYTWSKVLTDSDAQQDTLGAKMPFLRFTKGNLPHDYTTWFRNVFFANAAWTQGAPRQGNPVEETDIDVHVTLLGQNLGVRRMHVDHKPARAQNHNAPTTHLHYDQQTRQVTSPHELYHSLC